MTKTQLLSLNDWIKDPTDINLTLFVHSINPLAKWKKKELIALIEKYKGDSFNRIRLRGIELYLNSDKPEKVGKKSINKIKNPPEIPVKQVDPDKLRELEDKKGKYVSNLRKMGSKLAAEENERLKNEIETLETELGMRFEWDKLPKGAAEETHRALLYAVLGDPNVQGTPSWELLNGQKTYFELRDSGKNNTAGFGVDKLIETLEKETGRKIRPFSWRFDLGQGSTSEKGCWKFSLTPTMSTAQVITQQLSGYGKDLEKL